MKMITGLIEPSERRDPLRRSADRADPIALQAPHGLRSGRAPSLSAPNRPRVPGDGRPACASLASKSDSEAYRRPSRSAWAARRSQFPISSYSKGMRQKILLSSALMHNPDLILLDEPFSGLDVLLRRYSPQPDSGTRLARQGGALQLARTRNGGARLVARGDSASRQAWWRMTPSQPARPDGAASLEDIFSQLAVEQDTAGTARRIADLIRYEPASIPLLYREFLLRIIDLELIAPQGDMSKLLGQFAALLIYREPMARAVRRRIASASGRALPAVILSWAPTFPHLHHHARGGPVRRAELEFAFPGPPRRSHPLSLAEFARQRLVPAKVAAVATALALSVAGLNLFTGLSRPLDSRRPPPPLLQPIDAALPALGAGDMKSQTRSRSPLGAFARRAARATCTSWCRDGRIEARRDPRVFAYGNAHPIPYSKSDRSARPSPLYARADGGRGKGAPRWAGARTATDRDQRGRKRRHHRSSIWPPTTPACPGCPTTSQTTTTSEPGRELSNGRPLPLHRETWAEQTCRSPVPLQQSRASAFSAQPSPPIPAPLTRTSSSATSRDLWRSLTPLPAPRSRTGGPRLDVLWDARETWPHVGPGRARAGGSDSFHSAGPDPLSRVLPPSRERPANGSQKHYALRSRSGRSRVRQEHCTGLDFRSADFHVLAQWRDRRLYQLRVL